MPNNQIKEYLDNYRKLGASEFAVLIDGKWGSGKTWFIKDYIKKVEDNNSNDGGKNIIYISLFGLSSISEINSKFLEYYLKSVRVPKRTMIWKMAEAFGAVGEFRNILTALVRISSILAKEYSKFDTVIFDDLERCVLPTKELFGYINGQIISEKKKIILIASEQEINQSDDENEKITEYREIKQKIVGRTFQFSPDVNSAFEGFIDIISESDKKAASEIKEYKDQILEAYQKVEYDDLRNLKYFLEEMRTIWRCIPCYALKHNGLMTELIESLMIFLIEIRKGMITIDDIQDIFKK